MPALFAIMVMFGMAIHPAIERDGVEPLLNKDKVKVERVFDFNS